MFIHNNIEYISSSDLGFNTHNLLAVETSERISEKHDEVRSLLLQNPNITDITWTHSELIARVRHNVDRSIFEKLNTFIQFDMIFVSDNFFDFMDLDITSGRGFYLPTICRIMECIFLISTLKISSDWNLEITCQD